MARCAGCAAPKTARRLAKNCSSKRDCKPNQARELQQLPLAQLMAANFALGKQPAQAGVPSGFAPVFDNRVVTRHPFDPIANPLNADVPLIIGTTRTENTVFMMGDAEAFRLDIAGLKSPHARADWRAGRRCGGEPVYRPDAAQLAFGAVL